MKKLMVAVFAAALALVPAARAESPAQQSFTDLIEEHGSSAFSDGSSVYTFGADHSFELHPVGGSGRSIEGVWSQADGKLLVSGRWGWLNGSSLPSDFREMLLYVVYHGGEPVTVGYRQEKVLPVYFTVERLGSIQASVFEQRKAAAE